jgi:hypothetical protein
MKQIPSWEANGRSTSQKFLRLLWTPMFITVFTESTSESCVTYPNRPPPKPPAGYQQMLSQYIQYIWKPSPLPAGWERGKPWWQAS